ncbi:MAG: hypothetical protein EB059_07770 [Alphaproteobacteria bacterium]|nr:hypothetical protein [Alphaproteobacteria bacterium]
MQQSSDQPLHEAPLHEAWALAGLMRAQYGAKALPKALSEAEKDDEETAHIWRAVVECLAPRHRR